MTKGTYKTHERSNNFLTIIFLLQPADNKEVAETLIESIDTTAMTNFIDGLLKFKTRYAYTKTATKGTSMFLLVHFTDKIYHSVCLMFRIFSIPGMPLGSHIRVGKH